ncbi:amino acid transporter AVT1I-like [Senna tora]|uniref:Amino acid transporter AVT1I-like n=1 Tax=Senna tora TaxID=362788 RepID=A0A834W9P7_9FABA|nr:amino acid transporter AVT1I-like [Senna tora]
METQFQLQDQHNSGQHSVGILSMPYAVSQAGWISLILLLFVAILCWYTGLLLQKCIEKHPLIKTYPDIGEVAFGYKGRAIVSLFMYLELYLVATEFLILEGDNLEKLFPEMKFRIGGLRIGTKQGFVLITALVILPTTWLRSLKALAYVSVGGVVASVILVGCVVWVGVMDGVGFHERGEFVSDWGNLATSISLFVFCFNGHALLPTLCTSMRDQTQFPKVLLFCFITSTITYGSMAITGYLMYGEYIKSQVTLNLPTHKISTSIAIYTTLINPFTKYAFMVTPIATAIEDTLHFQKSRIFGIIIRTFIVVSTVIVALFIPFFGYLMGFIGAFLSVTVSLLLPCLCYLKIHRNIAQQLGFELGVIIGILIVGSFIGVQGTYSSLREIVNHLQKS